LITFKYSRESQESISNYMFKIGLLLKESKYFTTKQLEEKLIQIVKKVMDDKRA